MSESMDEAHSRDTRLQNEMRVARTALLVVAENAPHDLVLPCVEMAARLKLEEDHIVARWN